MGNNRKIAILVLIVACNCIQVSFKSRKRMNPQGSNLGKNISNIVGQSAGLGISKELGVTPGPGKANWVAAAYP
jgi:hypothetical protein